MGKSKAVYLLLPAVFLILGLMSVSVAFAANAVKGQADVVAKDSGEVAGTSKLLRKDDGISFDIKTEVERNHAFTVWIKVNEPPTIVLFGAGGTSDGKGKLHLKGGLPTGPIPEPDEEVVTDDGDGVFDTPFTSKVTLVIRDHGPKIPGQVYYQTHSLNGGCLKGEPNYIDGVGKCKSVQQAVHTPANEG